MNSIEDRAGSRSSIFRILFWSLLLLVVALTLLPVSVGEDFGGDKLQHFSGFFILGLLGGLGFGHEKRFAVAMGLAVLGGAIELLQATPMVGRDAHFLDFLADLAGIITGLLVSAAWRMKVTT